MNPIDHRSSRLLPIAVLIAAIIALHRLGVGALAPPPVSNPGDLARWAELRGPVASAFSILRVGALLVGYHLLGVTLLAMLARPLRSASLFRIAEALALPIWRSTLRRVVGVGLSATTILGGPVMSAAQDRAVEDHEVSGAAIMEPVTSTGTAQMHVIPEAPAPSTTAPAEPAEPAESTKPAEPAEPIPLPSSTTTEPAPETTSPRAEPTPTPPLDATAPPSPSPSPSPSSPTPPSPPRPPSGSDDLTSDRSDTASTIEHIVVPGDHLWALAEQRVSDARGGSADPSEIAPYWQRILDANPQLGDPDLIFPGDIIVLPPMR